MNSTTCWCFPS